MVEITEISAMLQKGKAKIVKELVQQALDEGTKAGNKGYDCAVSAIEMVNLLHELDAE